MYNSIPTWAKGLTLAARVNAKVTPLASGDPKLDSMLGGGLVLGQPHEILPKRSGWDDASVTAFTLAWLQRRQQTDQRLALWVMQRPSLYPRSAQGHRCALDSRTRSLQLRIRSCHWRDREL